MPASETPTNPKIHNLTGPDSSPTSVDASGTVDAPPSVSPDANAPLPSAIPASNEIDSDNPKALSGSRPTRSSSRYLDYETHELLETITQLEDDRRWQRIREGIWISIIAHIIFFSSLTWIPRYVFHQPQVIDPFDAIKNRKDLTYLDELPNAIKQVQKTKLPPLKQTQVDKKTLDALKAMPRPTAPGAPAPKQADATPPPQPAIQNPVPPQPTQLPPSTATSQPNPQIAQEPARPAPVPARPNFSLGAKNPGDQLRDDMRNSAHSGPSGGGMSGPSLGHHSGTGGGAEILSDTQGIDFGPYMQRVIRETYRTWEPLIPEEVNPPILKRGECEVVFTILPNGRLQPHAMLLTGRSGDIALDRAAWGAIEGADYPPLPREFHGPYLQLRFRFQYNIK
jgi:hypothetical protein